MVRCIAIVRFQEERGNMFELENDCMPTMNVKLIKVIFSQKNERKKV